MTKVSGTVLASRIAEGKLTAENKQQLAKQKAASKENLNIWKKEQEAKKEFGRGYQIELEKENRVKQGLPEYDVQKNTTPAPRKGRGKATTAEEIKKQQAGSNALGELRKKSRERAKALKNSAPTAPVAAPKAPVAAPKAPEATQTAPEVQKPAKKDATALHEKISGKEQPAQKFGGKTVFDSKTGKYVSKTSENVAKEAELKGNEIKKIKKAGLLKGKGGKAAAIVAIGAALIGGVAWLYNKVTGKNDEAETATPTPANQDKAKAGKANENTAPVAPAPTDKADKADENTAPVAPAPTDKADKADENTAPVAPAPTDKTDKADKTDKTDKTDKAGKAVPTNYQVKPGDCVWNIAKQHLKELNADNPNYRPTNAEILKHTKELMDLNQLVFEADGYHVMIKPNDSLKLVA